MNTFHLQIVTPEGMFFDGQAEKIIVRTIEGDVCVLGGLLSVKKGVTRLVANTFEWTEGH